MYRFIIVKDTAYNKGYNLIYTPPYQPKYNPIENVFSKIKNAFRNLNYKGFDCNTAIKMAISQVTSKDIINCFDNLKSIVNNY